MTGGGIGREGAAGGRQSEIIYYEDTSESGATVGGREGGAIGTAIGGRGGAPFGSGVASTDYEPGIGGTTSSHTVVWMPDKKQFGRLNLTVLH